MVVRSPRQEDLGKLTRHMPEVEGLSHADYLDLQRRDEGRYLVAWDGPTPVGRLFLRWRNIEVPRIVNERPHATPFADGPEICDADVTPERRSEGIGTQLILQALACAREAAAVQVTICVDTDNPRARALYERLGFSESGIGEFTTSGTFVDDDGKDQPWQNGPQVLLVLRFE